MMLFNVLLDVVGGFTPLLGNVFDFFWKGHTKNLQLLERPESAGPMLREAGWKLAALATFVAGLSFLTVWLLLYALTRYASWLFSM